MASRRRFGLRDGPAPGGFAVQLAYPTAKRLLITADAGGSNDITVRFC